MCTQSHFRLVKKRHWRIHASSIHMQLHIMLWYPGIYTSIGPQTPRNYMMEQSLLAYLILTKYIMQLNCTSVMWYWSLCCIRGLLKKVIVTIKPDLISDFCIKKIHVHKPVHTYMNISWVLQHFECKKPIIWLTIIISPMSYNARS